MISHQYKWIFIHIHKNGGSAVSRFLEPFSDDKIEMHEDATHAPVRGCPFDGAQLDTQPNLQKPGDPEEYKHWKACDFQRHRPEEYTTYTKFAIIRNPWERCLSAFLHFGWWWRLADDPKAVRNLPDQAFERFIAGTQYLGGNGRSKITRFTPQLAHLVKINGRLDENILCINYPKLDKGIKAISSKLGMDVSGRTFSRVNTTRNSDKHHYSLYYSDNAKELVRRVHMQDLSAFGFKFEDRR